MWFFRLSSLTAWKLEKTLPQILSLISKCHDIDKAWHDSRTTSRILNITEHVLPGALLLKCFLTSSVTSKKSNKWGFQGVLTVTISSCALHFLCESLSIAYLAHPSQLLSFWSFRSPPSEDICTMDAFNMVHSDSIASTFFWHSHEEVEVNHTDTCLSLCCICDDVDSFSLFLCSFCHNKGKQFPSLNYPHHWSSVWWAYTVFFQVVCDQVTLV